jgi:hypothetical protein
MNNNNSYLDGDFEKDFDIDFESNHTIESEQYYKNKRNPIVKLGSQVFNFVIRTITFNYNFTSNSTNNNSNNSFNNSNNISNSQEGNYDLICKKV